MATAQSPRVDGLNDVSTHLRNEVARILTNVPQILPHQIIDAANLLKQIDKLQDGIVRFADSVSQEYL